MKKEYQKPHNLDLYDFCIEIDARPVNCRNLAEKLGRPERYIVRKIERLRQIGIKIKSVLYGKLREKGSFFQYEFEEPIAEVLEKLDKEFGMLELYEKSSLSEQEQRQLIDTTIKVNNNSKHWPIGYFSNPKNRDEKLKVILPFCLENILFKEPEEIRKADLKLLGLEPVLKYFNKSVLRFLQIAYPWLTSYDRKEQKNKELSDLIKKRLNELGKTQRQLSEGSGISRHTISQYTTGKRTPAEKNLEKLFTALGLPYKKVEKEDNVCRGKDLNLGRH